MRPGPPAPEPRSDSPEPPLSLPTLEHAANHSVWDEPTAPTPSGERLPAAPVAEHERCSGCGYTLAGFTTDGVCPECGLPIDLRGAGYATWLALRTRSISPGDSWASAVLIAFAAGPLALLTAFWGSMELGDTYGIFSVIGIAPTIEEVAKVAAPLMVIETRPWLFRSRAQIVAVCLASALTFAAVENVLYLTVGAQGPDPALAAWRWSVCVALHMGCTAIGSLGLCRMHRETLAVGTRPRLDAALPYLVIAIVVHAAYNVFAMALHLTGRL